MLKTTEDQITDLQKQITDLKKQITDLKNMHETEHAAMAASMSNVMTKLESLEEKVNSLLKEIDDL